MHSKKRDYDDDKVFRYLRVAPKSWYPMKDSQIYSYLKLHMYFTLQSTHNFIFKVFKKPIFQLELKNGPESQMKAPVGHPYRQMNPRLDVAQCCLLDGKLRINNVPSLADCQPAYKNTCTYTRTYIHTRAHTHIHDYEQSNTHPNTHAYTYTTTHACSDNLVVNIDKSQSQGCWAHIQKHPDQLCVCVCVHWLTSPCSHRLYVPAIQFEYVITACFHTCLQSGRLLCGLSI